MLRNRESTWSDLTAYVSEGSLTASFAKSLAAIKISEPRKRELAAQVACGAITEDVGVALAKAEANQRAAQRGVFFAYLRRLVPTAEHAIAAGGTLLCVALIALPIYTVYRANIATMKTRESVMPRFAAACDRLLVALQAANIDHLVVDSPTTSATANQNRIPTSRANAAINAATVTLSILLDRRLRPQGCTVEQSSLGLTHEASLRVTITHYDYSPDSLLFIGGWTVRAHLVATDSGTGMTLWQDELDIGMLTTAVDQPAE